MRTRTLGLLALLCFGAHAGFHLWHGRPAEILWSCTTASGLVGLGLVLEQASVVAIGTSWLILGNPLWWIDLASGGDFYVTSLLTHVVCLGLGLVGLRRLGWPAGSWWRAAVALFVLLRITRLLTPASANINLAYAVYPGWEGLFPHYAVYLGAFIGLGASVFAAAEMIARRGLGWRAPLTALDPVDTLASKQEDYQS